MMVSFRQLAAAASVLSALGCTPDSFSYGGAGPGGGGPSSCDDDSCGLQCPPGSELVDGACSPLCGAWTATGVQSAAQALTIGPEKVFVVGSATTDDGREGRGWVQAFGSCAGRDMAAAVTGIGSTQGHGIAISGDSVCVAGSSDDGSGSKGFLAKLDAARLEEKSVEVVEASTTGDGLAAVIAVGNAFWAVGTSDVASGGRAWAVKSDASGQCATQFGDTPSRAVAVAAEGAGVHALVADAAGLKVVTFDDAACATTSCQCQPSGSVGPFTVAGATDLEPRAIAVRDGVAYLAGRADERGFVLSVELGAGAVVAAAPVDVGMGPDAVHSLTVQGDKLWVGGSLDLDEAVVTGSGRAFISRLALPLGDAAEPEWQWQADNYNSVVAVAAGEGSGEVYWLAGRPDSYLAVHCFDDATCSVY